MHSVNNIKIMILFLYLHREFKELKKSSRCSRVSVNKQLGLNLVSLRQKHNLKWTMPMVTLLVVNLQYMFKSFRAIVVS